MNRVLQIRVGFFRFLKTRKLERRLGAIGVLAFLKLYEFAIEFKPNGDLSGIPDDDLELAIDWMQGEPLIQALFELGLIEGEEGSRYLPGVIESGQKEE